MTKNEILNSDSDARLSAAGNPNTPVEVLTELARIVTGMSAVAQPGTLTHRVIKKQPTIS